MRFASLVVAGVLTLLSVSPAAAEPVQAGVRAGFLAEAGEPAYGIELVLPVGERWTVSPSADVTLGSDPRAWTIAGEILRDLSCTCSPDTMVWAGGGPAVTTGGDDSEVALALTGGFGVRLGRLVPNVQLRGRVGSTSEIGLFVGLRY